MYSAWTRSGASGSWACLARVFAGSHLTDPFVRLERTGVLTIETLPARADRRTLPCPMADGEALVRLPLRLEAVRGVVPVLLPC